MDAAEKLDETGCKSLPCFISLSVMCWLAACIPECFIALAVGAQPSAALQCWGVRGKARQLGTKDLYSQHHLCSVQRLHWANCSSAFGTEQGCPLVCVICCILQIEQAKWVRWCSEHRYLLSALLINALPSTLSLLGILTLSLVGCFGAKYKQTQYLNLSNLLWWKYSASFFPWAVFMCHGGI